MTHDELKDYIKDLSDSEVKAIVEALKIIPWKAIEGLTIADLFLATDKAIKEIVKELEATC